MNTVKQLRQIGYKVKIEHYRLLSKGGYIPYSRKTKGAINNNGGFTVATITNPEGVTKKGVAACSKEDQFCYKSGAKLAMKKAMEELGNTPF